MFTNKCFELSPTQLQAFNDWAQVQVRAEWQEECEGFCLEVVFEFSHLGRGVVVRSSGSHEKVVLEDVWDGDMTGHTPNDA